MTIRHKQLVEVHEILDPKFDRTTKWVLLEDRTTIQCTERILNLRFNKEGELIFDLRRNNATETPIIVSAERQCAALAYVRGKLMFYKAKN